MSCIDCREVFFTFERHAQHIKCKRCDGKMHVECGQREEDGEGPFCSRCLEARAQIEAELISDLNKESDGLQKLQESIARSDFERWAVDGVEDFEKC